MQPSLRPEQHLVLTSFTVSLLVSFALALLRPAQDFIHILRKSCSLFPSLYFSLHPLVETEELLPCYCRVGVECSAGGKRRGVLLYCRARMEASASALVQWLHTTVRGRGCLVEEERRWH